MKKTLNISGKIIGLDEPKIMGVINITPDSFYKDSRFNLGDEGFLKKAEKMIDEGATFLDIGGYSSRPGAANVSEEDEIERVVFAVSRLRKMFSNLLISVDTFRAKVADAAVQNGADLVNDISGGSLDPKMFDFILKNKIPYILMHMRGNPQNMNQMNGYEDVAYEVQIELLRKVNDLKNKGFTNLVVDPGFGFAKNVDQNYELLNTFDTSVFEVPLLAGISRKSMIYKLFDLEPGEILAETSALHLQLLLKNIDILRVHDVAEAGRIVQIFKRIQP
jgi:dihydropteroate synthase